ncbi:uncharacterized methyltransferase At1g78140, chloroplastic [Momordica charantia]|uniref:Uncharacterized methyltransferase At1g78140, chloroplastic n=1 Tax=Momordica charantia TaxID=3673 RepID=A0A6J1D0A7_MOMCH|nr:uncharacterized methyltransferase At1g78140, chloroplastic [Momordica charantia]
MAAVVAKHMLLAFVPTRLCFFRRCCFFNFDSPTLSISTRISASTVPASSIASMDTRLQPSDSSILDREVNNIENILACSVCYGPLTAAAAGSGLSVESTNGYQLECGTCRKTFTGSGTHLDLTIASGNNNYGDPMPASTEIFRTRLVSFLYERGWRQSFSVALGFPGPETEFELIRTFMTPILGGNIIDASCGSGLFSRIFAKSGLFSSVVALDYSENMLKQCYEFIQQEENFPRENLVLIRADIARLPFASNSVDAVHAGAALHCWPSPSAAVAEISRILRPGGVFVASTFIADGPFSFIPFLGTQRERVKQITGSHIVLSERELEELCRACGLVGFRCVRNRLFVMISATKPS